MDVERTIEFILQAQAQAEVEHAQFREQLRKIAAQGEKTEAALRRAIRLAVEEARHERRRRRELNEQAQQQMAELRAAQQDLAAAQQVTEQKLQGLIDSLNRRGNGHPQ